MKTSNEILDLIKEWEEKYTSEHQDYMKKGEENDWDEEYEDTLERKWSEGASDILKWLREAIEGGN